MFWIYFLQSEICILADTSYLFKNSFTVRCTNLYFPFFCIFAHCTIANISPKTGHLDNKTEIFQVKWDIIVPWIMVSHCFRFYEIFYQDQNVQHNISWLQILWDITPEPQYLTVADIMRYHIIISLGCRFHAILYQIHYHSFRFY